MGKNGLDFFPFVCQLDDKLELIEAEFGLKGLAIIVKLFQRIYGENGYYCEWNDEVALLFSRKQCGLKLGDNVVLEVVNAALKRRLFSEEIFRTHGVLTSAGIQRRYLEAAKRRTKVEVKKDYLLLKVAQIPKNVDIISENVYTNEKNVCTNQQRKGKESKVKESKGEESNSCSVPAAAATEPRNQSLVITMTLNDNSEHPVYLEQTQEWMMLYPAVDVMQQLRNMRGWLLANPSKRKTKRGINQFINTWLSKEQNKGGGYANGKFRGNTGFASSNQSAGNLHAEESEGDRLKKLTEQYESDDTDCEY